MNVQLTIPEKYKKATDLVAISREEYEQFLQLQRETEDAVPKIKRAEREYEEGKTLQIDSVADLIE